MSDDGPHHQLPDMSRAVLCRRADLITPPIDRDNLRPAGNRDMDRDPSPLRAVRAPRGRIRAHGTPIRVAAGPRGVAGKGQRPAVAITPNPLPALQGDAETGPYEFKITADGYAPAQIVVPGERMIRREVIKLKKVPGERAPNGFENPPKDTSTGSAERRPNRAIFPNIRSARRISVYSGARTTPGTRRIG
jgi:hypothetical protein